MAKFDERFTLTLPLEAQSPMIHFQARETGATIRATEVKPKFDRFLCQCLRERGAIPDAMIQKNPDGNKPDAVPSLKYRMRIYCPEAPQIVSVNNSVKGPHGYVKLQENSYTLFYGNAGKQTLDKQVMGILSNPVLEIQCLNAELRKLIEETVTEFFLTTNFGTMQSKGFGSFAPAEYCRDNRLNDAQREEIAGFLKSKSGMNTCYCMKIRDFPSRDKRGVLDYTAAFKNIRCFYQLMKSGYNDARSDEYEKSYLFQYMRDFGIGNEKAWMKQRGISPNVARSPKAKELKAARTLSDSAELENARYVRAFLGTAGNITYQKDPGGYVNVTISNIKKDGKEGSLKRVPSPIFFKIVKDTVFITAFPVPEEVYGQAYKFSGNKDGTLETPSHALLKERTGQEIFDIEGFLRRYVEHYNDPALWNPDAGKLKNYLYKTAEVEEV